MGFRPFLMTTMVFLRDCNPGTCEGRFSVPSPGDGVEPFSLRVEPCRNSQCLVTLEVYFISKM